VSEPIELVADVLEADGRLRYPLTGIGVQVVD
jgi:hypothetical protein